MLTTVRRPAAPTPAAPEIQRAARQLLLFQVSDALCGLPIHAVREVIALPLLSRPPGLPSLLEGFLNLGGTAIPALRLDRLFGLREFTPDLYTPLLVLHQPEDRIALVVESVRGMVTVLGDAMRPIPRGESFNDCVVGEITVDDQVASVLAADRILLEKERQCLAELQAVEQDRIRQLAEARP